MKWREATNTIRLLTQTRGFMALLRHRMALMVTQTWLVVAVMEILRVAVTVRGYGNYTDPTIYYGTSGSNIVHTNTFDPSITQILALGGNDTIYLYSSAPLSQFSNIDGGTGTDILSFINYSAGLTSFNPFSSSIKGIEQFVGTNYNDSIILTSGLITTFDGAGGNDTLNFSSFASAINFTLGVTTTYGTFTNFDSAIGTNYGDTVIGTSGDNVIDGGTGDDFITGNGGNDTIYGGANNNTIYTGSGNDTIYGGSLGDNIFLGGGNDTIDGGAGGGTNQLHFVFRAWVGWNYKKRREH